MSTCAFLCVRDEVAKLGFMRGTEFQPPRHTSPPASFAPAPGIFPMTLDLSLIASVWDCGMGAVENADKALAHVRDGTCI